MKVAKKDRLVTGELIIKQIDWVLEYIGSEPSRKGMCNKESSIMKVWYTTNEKCVGTMEKIEIRESMNANKDWKVGKTLV